jgi:hypothetical protein
VNILKKIGPWVVSAALCLMAVEILGVAVFYRDAGSLVYFNRAKATGNTTVPKSADAPVYKQHLHPYFGYTGPYSLHGPSYTNNLGFPQSQSAEVPFKPGPNDFVVIVSGGSVASNLVSPPQQGRPLQQALQRLPQLAGKNVVVFSTAQGPGKQPQQVMELAFLIAWGQHIDFVLNLDGTLEFVSGINNFENGVEPIFPPVDVFGAIGRELAPMDTSSTEYYEMAYGVTHARAEANRYTLLLDNSRSGIAYLKNAILKAVYAKILEHKLKTYQQIVTKKTGWDEVRKLMGMDMPLKTSKEKIFEDIFDIWIRCSDLMKTMANAQGAQYLNIVHPNPYHSKKTFSESEKAVLNLPETNYFRNGASAGHALMESHAELLKSKGIVSGMTMFDNIADTIYIDSTGHLSKLGETMLADFAASQIGARLASPQEK